MPVTTKQVVKVDLVTKRPNPKVLMLGKTTVEVGVQIVDNEKPPPIVMKRVIDSAVTPTITRYQNTLDKELKILEGKVLEMVKKGDAKGAEKIISETAVSITGAVGGLQGAVNNAVKQLQEDDKRKDKLLLEAQIKTGVNVGIIVIKAGTDVAKLVGSAGTDVTAYVNLAKGIYKIVMIIRDETKGEAAVRQDFLKEIGGYTTGKQRAVVELEAKAKKAGKPFKLDPPTLKAVGAAVKPQAAKVEVARKKYQNKTTKMRHNLVSLSNETVKMEKAMKGAKDLKRGVELGAKVIKLKGGVDRAYAKLTRAEKFAADMAMLLTEAGLKMDDRTFGERLRQLDVDDWAKIVKELYDASKELVDTLVDVAA